MNIFEFHQNVFRIATYTRLVEFKARVTESGWQYTVDFFRIFFSIVILYSLTKRGYFCILYKQQHALVSSNVSLNFYDKQSKLTSKKKKKSRILKNIKLKANEFD